MAKKEAFTIFAISLFLHAIFAINIPSFMLNNWSPFIIVTGINLTIGISVLLFPVFGFLADVKLTRYRMIQLSILILIGTLILVLITLILSVAMSGVTNMAKMPISWALIGAAISISIIIIITGIFEANAIQFGLDQLLDTSSSQLSAFIHWYFWSIHLGQEVVFGITLVIGIPLFCTKLSESLSYSAQSLIVYTSSIVLLLIWMSCMAVCSFFLHQAKNKMYIAKMGLNPFKQMWKVLKFAYEHKYPLKPTAFIFCEDTTASRIDYGKIQYGGPFSTEEVEDVKTFLRLLLLLLTLFGYHVAGDGFAIAHHMQWYSCPSLIVWELFTFNPTFTTGLVVLVSIPVVKCLPKIHKYTPNMLKRIGIGLILLVVQELIYIFLSLKPVIDASAADITNITTLSNVATRCMLVRTNASNASSIPDADNIFLWLIVPQVLNGLAQILVHMTTLEFICAQAPRTLQGLLIGLWYAMFSIRYLLMCSLDQLFITSSQGMLIYQAVRTGFVLLSLVFYLHVSRAYQYRIRDWVVHVQWVVEDVFERRIDQEQQFWEQRENERQQMCTHSSCSRDYKTFY